MTKENNKTEAFRLAGEAIDLYRRSRAALDLGLVRALAERAIGLSDRAMLLAEESGDMNIVAEAMEAKLTVHGIIPDTPQPMH